MRWKKPIQRLAGALQIFEEAFNQGYPHELKHFIECVQQNKQPL